MEEDEEGEVDLSEAGEAAEEGEVDSSSVGGGGEAWQEAGEETEAGRGRSRSVSSPVPCEPRADHTLALQRPRFDGPPGAAQGYYKPSFFADPWAHLE